MRRLEKDIDAVRFDAPEGKIELPVSCACTTAVRAACQMVDAARGNYGSVTKDRHSYAQEAVLETWKSDVGLHFVFDLCVSSASPGDLCRSEYAAAAQCLSRPASAARQLNKAPPI